MLLVNAHVGPSQIHGRGLIAHEFVPAGTVVWEFMPGFDVSITEAQLDHLSPAARQHVFYWSYFHVPTRTFILSSDDDRFTNHADDPNTREHNGGTISTRDIMPGDEITIDYNELVMINFPVPNDYGVKWVQQSA
jgi:uncharacterized protein